MCICRDGACDQRGPYDEMTATTRGAESARANDAANIGGGGCVDRALMSSICNNAFMCAMLEYARTTEAATYREHVANAGSTFDPGLNACMRGLELKE